MTYWINCFLYIYTKLKRNPTVLTFACLHEAITQFNEVLRAAVEIEIFARELNTLTFFNSRLAFDMISKDT